MGAEAASLPTAMFAGTIIFATGIAIDATIVVTLAETSDDIDPAAVQALAALFDLVLVLSVILALRGRKATPAAGSPT